MIREKKIVILGSIGLHMEYSNEEMGLTVGGEGYDIALSFARMQEPCVFGTAVHQGAFSDFILLDAEEHNIQILVETNPNLKFAGTMRKQNESGEFEQFSVSPVFQKGIQEEITHRCLEMAKGIVVEGAFSGEYIDGIIKKVETRQVGIFLIVRRIEDLDKILKIESKISRKVISNIDNELIDYSKFPENLEILNISKTGNVSYFNKEGRTDLWNFSKNVQTHIFVLLASSIINQSLAWTRGLIKATEDCRFTMEEAVEWDTTWVSHHSIDRKFSKYFKHVENLEHDFLTGLKTRGTTNRYIEKLLHDLTPFSIFMVDIDHFKSVNDTWGHDMGDLVLSAVAREIGKSLRTTDICGRWGGEEFIVIMPSTTVDMAFNTADRIRKKIMELEGMPRQITASFGLAQHIPGHEFAETLSFSDKGLYKAKRTGRNQVVQFIAGMDEGEVEDAH